LSLEVSDRNDIDFSHRHVVDLGTDLSNHLVSRLLGAGEIALHATHFTDQIP
jgi:hypothetical protein